MPLAAKSFAIMDVAIIATSVNKWYCGYTLRGWPHDTCCQGSQKAGGFHELHCFDSFFFLLVAYLMPIFLLFFVSLAFGHRNPTSTTDWMKKIVNACMLAFMLACLKISVETSSKLFQELLIFCIDEGCRISLFIVFTSMIAMYNCHVC